MNQLLHDTTITKLKRKRAKASRLVITSVKIPRNLASAIKAEARKTDRSQTWIIKEALASYISFRTRSPK